MKLNDIYMRDPFIFVENEVAYLVGTTDKNAWGGKGCGFLGYKSTDLMNFDGPYTLFKASDNFWADENFWAPELHKYNGKYYIFASFKKKGVCRASQCLICDIPFGNFKPIKSPFTPHNWECLDATLYIENNIPYTVFCHEWLQVEDGEMVLAELSEDFTQIKSEPEILFRASEAPWTRSHDGKNYITDGPFLYRLKNGKLLMLWSSNGAYGYAMGIAISDNGIHGPWKHVREPFINRDGGHGMIFKFKNKLYVIFHQPNEPHMSERPHILEIVECSDNIELVGCANCV